MNKLIFALLLCAFVIPLAMCDGNGTCGILTRIKAETIKPITIEDPETQKLFYEAVKNDNKILEVEAPSNGLPRYLGWVTRRDDLQNILNSIPKNYKIYTVAGASTMDKIWIIIIAELENKK